ncbi:hypothetical protein V8E55_004175, partial [Tylopilus felleus]
DLHEKDSIVQQLCLELQEQGLMLQKEDECTSEQYGALFNQAMKTTQETFKKQFSSMHSLLVLREGEAQTFCREMEMQSKEHVQLKAQVQHECKTLNQMYTDEVAKIHNQFEIQFQAQKDELLQSSSTNLVNALQECDRDIEAKMIGMERCLQDEIGKLSETMRAEKERELANMEQRYTCRGVQPSDRPTTAPPNAPTTTPSNRPAPAPQLPQNLAMADFASAIEVTLQNIFVNGSHNQMNPLKRSPRHKKIEDEEVSLENEFRITQDVDFVAHEMASLGDVQAYEYEDGPGPDAEQLAFDLSQGYNSPWNLSILKLLLYKLQARCQEENWPIKKSNNYIREALRCCYKQLRTVWLRNQPRLTHNDVLETPAEKYLRWVTTLNGIVQLKTESSDDDVIVWGWLKHLVNLLGENGMSSEESAVENNIEHLDIIDIEHLIDSDIFSPQGSKPVKRIRVLDNLVSSRDAVKGLPADLYDGAWFSKLTQQEIDILGVTPDRFNWMRVATI